MTPQETARVPAPSAAEIFSIFPIFGAFPLGPRARPTPGLPRGRDISVSPAPPPQATSGPCPSAALGPGAGPRGGRAGRASRRRPGLPPALPVPAPAAARPSSPPQAQPASPSPRRARPAWQLAPRAWGPPRREGFAARAGAGEPAREGGRPPPAPLLLALLRGRRSLLPPPPSSLLPPSLRHPRTAGPRRPPSLPELQMWRSGRAPGGRARGARAP